MSIGGPNMSIEETRLPWPLLSASPASNIWAVSRFFESLAALFQGTHPEISSGGKPQTFIYAVSFGMWQNQSKFEAD